MYLLLFLGLIYLIPLNKPSHGLLLETFYVTVLANFLYAWLGISVVRSFGIFVLLYLLILTPFKVRLPTLEYSQLFGLYLVMASLTHLYPDINKYIWVPFQLSSFSGFFERILKLAQRVVMHAFSFLTGKK